MPNTEAGTTDSRQSDNQIDLSIVVPIFDECHNIRPLYERIKGTLAQLDLSHEIIFVNDDSRDGGDEVLRCLAGEDRLVKVINFRRNVGQTAALMAGFDRSIGKVIIPMDGDLQNDPSDIPNLLAKLEEGYSVVSGWRSNRQDKFLTRKVPSFIANKLISWLSGVQLHDYGCTLKAYRREILREIRLYGEMHRLIPIYASWQGARITEIPVNHHARLHGESKYGMGRVVHVLLDLILIKFLEDYQTKPLYVFGIFGMICIAMSFVTGVFAVYLRIFEGVSFILTPLPLLVVMTFITGILSILLGLLAELMVRIYFETQDKPIYAVRDVINFDPPD